MFRVHEFTVPVLGSSSMFIVQRSAAAYNDVPSEGVTANPEPGTKNRNPERER
jgi:hypothetical protein